MVQACIVCGPGLGTCVDEDIVLGQWFLSHSSQLEPVVCAIISIHQTQLSLNVDNTLS